MDCFSLPEQSDVAERYTYFATMQSWLKDYTNFINTKFNEIEAYVKVDMIIENCVIDSQKVCPVGCLHSKRIFEQFFVHSSSAQ